MAANNMNTGDPFKNVPVPATDPFKNIPAPQNDPFKNIPVPATDPFAPKAATAPTPAPAVQRPVQPAPAPTPISNPAPAAQTPVQPASAPTPISNPAPAAQTPVQPAPVSNPTPAPTPVPTPEPAPADKKVLPSPGAAAVSIYPTAATVTNEPYQIQTEPVNNGFVNQNQNTNPNPIQGQGQVQTQTPYPAYNDVNPSAPQPPVYNNAQVQGYQAPPVADYNTGAYPVPSYDDGFDHTPLSMWKYFGYEILFSIPLIGLIFLIIKAVSSKNINLRNFARSYFVLIILALIIAGGTVGILLGLGFLYL